MEEVKNKKGKNNNQKNNQVAKKVTTEKKVETKKNTQKKKTGSNNNKRNNQIAKKVPPKKKTETKKNTPKKKLEAKVEGPNLQELEVDIKKDILSEKHNHNKSNLLILIILFIVLVIIFIGMHVLIPKIIIKKENPLEISYQQEYVEYGATANYLGKDLTNKIKISGKVDSSKVGHYQITYTVKEGIFEIHKSREVYVVDKEAPSIVLEGEKEVNICPNTEFKELGYTATDEYDGDLTNQVQIKKKKDKIVYTVKDSSGNKTSITRKINQIDVVSPTITLKGNETMYITPTETYNEPGFTAEDNCSGNLTNKVTVTGEVKNGQIGTYSLIYEVEDDASNKITVERKVIISERTDPNSGMIKNGVIYLTFDDGPSNVTTGEILDVLKEEGVKATFFVTNGGPDYLIKRMYDEGHTVALHTATHNYTTVYSSVDAYFNDLNTVSNRVKRITGQTSKIIRFPGGSSNTVSRRYCSKIMSTLVEEVLNRGYRYYDWNVDSQDAAGANREQVYHNVTSRLSKNKANMVLMHDIKISTRDAIRDIIRYGKENGYTFERIDMDTYMIRQQVNN